jgi:hypothetical protein
LNNDNKNIEFRLKRETGDIIQTTLSFLRSEYKQLGKLIAIYVLPFMVLYAITQVFLQIKLTEAAGALSELEPENLMAELGGLYGNLLLIIFFNVFVQSLLVALVYSYIQVYLQRGRGNISDTEVTALLFPNSGKALITGFFASIMSLMGLTLCLLPGIIIANSLSLAIFIAIFENKGLGYSFLRSWALVKRQWWATFALNVIGILFVWLASITISLPAVFYDAFSGNVASEPAVIPQWRWWVSGLSVVGSSVTAVVVFIFLALQYFNLTEREKEEVV